MSRDRKTRKRQYPVKIVAHLLHVYSRTVVSAYTIVIFCLDLLRYYLRALGSLGYACSLSFLF